MRKGSTHKEHATSPIRLCGSRADVSGVLQLLLSAKVSVEYHSVDQICADDLEECISHLRKRYGLSQVDLNSGDMCPEFSLPAVVRLLTYVQAEVTDSLNERLCADRLQRCIAHLMKIHQIPQAHLYERELSTSH